MLVCYYKIFQLTFGTVEPGHKKSSQLAAVFNDPEMPFGCSRLKRRLVYLLGPMHQIGNITLECDHRRNICGSSAAEMRGPFLSRLQLFQRAATLTKKPHQNHLTPFSGFHEPCSFRT